MNIDVQSGLIEEVNFQASPNHDQRPSGEELSVIVVHCISLPPGEFGGQFIGDFFQNRLDTQAHPYFEEISELKVSAHAFISREGKVTQFVPFHQRAWHAGVSSFQGKEAVNDFSIGIELEGADDLPFRTMQYWALTELIAALRQSYPSLSDCPIVGHSDIAPGRKTDPGPGFSWSRLHRLLDKFHPQLTEA